MAIVRRFCEMHPLRTHHPDLPGMYASGWPRRGDQSVSPPRPAQGPLRAAPALYATEAPPRDAELLSRAGTEFPTCLDRRGCAQEPHWRARSPLAGSLFVSWPGVFRLLSMSWGTVLPRIKGGTPPALPPRGCSSCPKASST